MSAAQALAQRAHEVAASGAFDCDGAAPLPSPCVSVCRMTQDRSHCVGCFRTLDELRAWRGAEPAAQRAIWARALQRAGLALPTSLESA